VRTVYTARKILLRAMVSCCKWRSGYRYMERLDAGYQTGIAARPSGNETAAYNPGWHNEKS
jgi:hypothetical protein